MKSKKFMEENYREILIEKLKGIATFDLLTNSSSLIEKILWLLLVIIGICWGYHFMKYEMIDTWKEQPKIISKANVDLMDLKYPAVTFCSKGAAKFGIAERLGNFYNPKMDLPSEFLSLRKDLAICSTGIDDYFKDWKIEDFEDKCQTNSIRRKRSAWNLFNKPTKENQTTTTSSNVDKDETFSCKVLTLEMDSLKSISIN